MTVLKIVRFGEVRANASRDALLPVALRLSVAALPVQLRALLVAHGPHAPGRDLAWAAVWPQLQIRT